MTIEEKLEADRIMILKLKQNIDELSARVTRLEYLMTSKVDPLVNFGHEVGPRE